MAIPAHTVVFHSGALGDFVLIWPLLRTLVRSRTRLSIIAPSEKAKLARAELVRQAPEASPPEAVGIEQPRFTSLWAAEPASTQPAEPEVGLVLTFIADDASQAGRLWLSSAQKRYPNARVRWIGPPGSESRLGVWRELDVERLGAVAKAAGEGGPIVLHAGAGSRQKRWPVECWAKCAASLRDDTAPSVGTGPRPRPSGVELICGEVEAEQFTTEEQRTFRLAGGTVCAGLAELAERCRGAALVIAADTGPGHLAAQLGVKTLSLFGPTDPAVWSPRGPAVRVLAPPSLRAMTWLGVDEVARAAREMIGIAEPNRSAGKR